MLDYIETELASKGIRLSTDARAAIRIALADTSPLAEFFLRILLRGRIETFSRRTFSYFGSNEPIVVTLDDLREILYGFCPGFWPFC